MAFAETQAPDTVEFSAKQLRNHLPQILQAVVDDLRSPQTDSQQLAKSHGLAPLKPGPESAASYHGRTRAIAGFGLNQMVAEYRALRASVLRRWASDQQLATSSIDDILRFNEAIEQAVAESLAQFSAEVESWRQIFLAALGHDLRGPLAAVMFSADTLASGLQDPALAKQAERIINGSMRMNKLLDDLLAYSRSKLGDGMAIHPVDCDLAQSLGEEVELLRAALPHVPITYEVEGDARGCFDASSLREAVHNLTTNAAKYGEHGTDVRISLEGLVDQIMITVSNTGAELPDEAFNSRSIPCAEARTTRHRGNTRALASACSWCGKSATRTAALSMDDGGMAAPHSSLRSRRVLIEATDPATALQEPVHHEDIDQPALAMPEGLWQPSNHRKPQLPVQRHRRAVGADHVIELHGQEPFRPRPLQAVFHQSPAHTLPLCRRIHHIRGAGHMRPEVREIRAHLVHAHHPALQHSYMRCLGLEPMRAKRLDSERASKGQRILRRNGLLEHAPHRVEIACTGGPDLHASPADLWS